MPGTYTDPLVHITPGLRLENTYRGVSGYELAPADTLHGSQWVATTLINLGTNPQSVALTPLNVSALAAYMDINTVNEGAGGVTATLSLLTGRVVMTHAGSTGLAALTSRTLTLTNTLVVPGTHAQVCIVPGTTTIPGMIVRSVTPTANTLTIVCYNAAAVAQNGTWVVAFLIEPQAT